MAAYSQNNFKWATKETFAAGNRKIDTFTVALEPGTNLVYGIDIGAPVD
jgi:hypothetical protein